MFSILTIEGEFVCGCACWNTSREYAEQMAARTGKSLKVMQPDGSYLLVHSDGVTTFISKAA